MVLHGTTAWGELQSSLQHAEHSARSTKGRYISEAHGYLETLFLVSENRINNFFNSDYNKSYKLVVDSHGGRKKPVQQPRCVRHYPRRYFFGWRRELCACPCVCVCGSVCVHACV